METLLSLMGEQPMPVLLPARMVGAERNVLVTSADFRQKAEYLARLISGAIIVEVKPYDLEGVYRAVRGVLEDTPDAVLNMTGGTKIMALAALHAAGDRKCRVVYMTTQGGTCRLDSYYLGKRIARLEKSEDMPELITAKDYLLAHLPGFSIKPPRETNDYQTQIGFTFEQTIARVLRNDGFEVLANVAPEGMEKQEEIDLVVRKGNIVGVVEVKYHARDSIKHTPIRKPNEEWKPKRGYEQLLALCAREYLGLETKRVFITNYKNPKALKAFGDNHGIRTIELPTVSGGVFPARDKTDEYRLVKEMREALR